MEDKKPKYSRLTKFLLPATLAFSLGSMAISGYLTYVINGKLVSIIKDVERLKSAEKNMPKVYSCITLSEQDRLSDLSSREIVCDANRDGLVDLVIVTADPAYHNFKCRSGDYGVLFRSSADTFARTNCGLEGRIWERLQRTFDSAGTDKTAYPIVEERVFTLGL